MFDSMTVIKYLNFIANLIEIKVFFNQQNIHLDHIILFDVLSLQTGEFDWGRELRGTLSSSFFWGYVLTQFVGGWIAQM